MRVIHRPSTRLSSAAVVFAALLLPAAASASPLFELAGASTGTGGYNARVTGAGAASTYFNPALLARATQGFDVGLLVLSDQISMTLDGRRSGNVPLTVGDRGIFDKNGNPISNATVPTDWLEHGCKTCGSPPFAARPRQADGSSGNTNAYAVLGLVNRLFKDRLVLGFYALIPVGDFTTAHSFYNDEREQFFSNSLHPEMYSDRLTATSLSFGAGSKILDQLSVGVSFTLNLTNSAEASTYVRDPIDYNKLLISNDIHVRAAVSPHFGIAYDPLAWLHLAGTVHSDQRFTINTGIKASLPAGNESTTTRNEVHSFLPWTFGVGGSVDLNRGAPQEFSIAGNLRYALWSDYLDRHGESPGAEGPDFAFKNVFAGTLGVRHHAGQIDTFLDVNYQPTPVPPQTGRSNYVDNDRIGALIGGQYQFWLGELPLKVGVQLQAQRLLARHQTKNDSLIVDELPDDAVDSHGTAVPGRAGLQTNNPGWPGFASEGWILGGAVSASLNF
jgi:long-chain fatty acid transport protein